MKNLRLAFFNIKKHKYESISMIILVMICNILLSVGATNLIDVQKIYGDVVERNHGVENWLVVNEDNYHGFYDEFITNDDRVSRFEHVDGANSMSSKFIGKDGDEATQYMVFFNEENEKKMEEFNPVSTLSEMELAELEHPVYFPYYVQDTLGFEEGDTFTIILNGKQYPFEIAGFFESCIYSDNMYSLKAVISDTDYRVIEPVVGKTICLGYDTYNAGDARTLADDLLAYVDDNTSNGERMNINGMLFDDMATVCGVFIKIVLAVMMIMSVVVLASVLIMIGNQISNDIGEQVVSIGVLEAIGYQSTDIMMSYVFEYFLLGSIGAVLGCIGTSIISPTVFHLGEMISSHHAEASFHGGLYLLFAMLLVLFILAIALICCSKVKKYPPVVAFRRGISDHHYRKTSLPLEKTKFSVHLRLALKGFASNLRSNIGVGICIVISSCAIVTCFLVYDFCAEGSNALIAVTGMELPEIRLTVTDDTDASLFREELLKDDRVDTILLSNDWLASYIQCGDMQVVPVVYGDYGKTTKIHPTEGRLPKHDNEVMISSIYSVEMDKKIGDTIILKFGRIEKDYIVCGTVTSMTNAGANVYLTDAGYRCIKPSYKPNVLEINLKEGVDYKAYDAYLANTYGKSIGDAMESETEGDTAEARITAEAEKQMATLLSMYGISHVEYAVMLDGKIISGSSSIFKIKSSISLREILETQTSGAMLAIRTGAEVFMIIAAVVIMIIMLMIMSSCVKRQRHELGILKSMGYTSRELMLQLAFRIVPVLVMGVILGSILGANCGVLLASTIGEIEISAFKIFVIDFAIVLFSFACAYMGAHQIRKISVYELLSE